MYDALAGQLPDGWRAWHSLKVRTPAGWEGEGDFVIAAPDRGLLVLEVKGGLLHLSDGIWYQNDRRLEKAPRDQAQRYVRLLIDAMADRGCELPPFGVACAFPEVDFSDGPRAGDLAGLVIGKRDLPRIREALAALLERALPREASAPRSDRWLETLHELWGETWVPSLLVRDQVRAADERIVALDAEQLQILNFAGETPRAVVRGGAGSGKSLVAREMCARAARAGRRALYVCFTDALGRVLDEQLRSMALPRGMVRAIPIRRFAAELLETRNLPIRSTDPKFWAQVSLEAACDALPAERPHLVVVDEGQDLEEADWTLVDALAQDGSLWVFADERQAFWRDRKIPDFISRGAAALRLGAQKRNPAGVARLASRYVLDAPDIAAPPVQDGSVRLIEVAAGQLEARLRVELNELRRAGAGADDIAILTLAGQTLSEVLKLEKIGDHAVVRADHQEASQCTIADTFLRFKGLERPFILLVELAVGTISQYDTRMHIALTRATVQATILCTPEHRASDPRLAM